MMAGKLQACALLILAASSIGTAQQYTISTIAGATLPSSAASATGFSIGSPRRIAFDASGNFYFTSLNAVFKVNSGGAVTLVAGTGHAGFSGDGGLAINAQLNAPEGIAIGADGKVYIADSKNNRIRSVSAAGVISTFAGDGAPGEHTAIGDGGPATSAHLNLPTGLALDSSGSLYIADTGNHSIRKVVPGGAISSIMGNTFAGNNDAGNSGLVAANAQLNSPKDVAIGPSSSLYVADYGNALVRRINSDGTYTNVAGTGGNEYSGDGAAATKAGLRTPYSIAVASDGSFYISQLDDSRIRKVDTSANISTIAGTGIAGFSGDGSSAANAQLNGPTGIELDSSGNLYIADSINLRVRKIAGTTISTVAGNGVYSYAGDGSTALKAMMNGPRATAVDASGNVYVSDLRNNVVRKVAKDGSISNFAGTGTAGFGGDGGNATAAQLNGPAGLAVDGSGSVYIADTQNNRVRKVTAQGVISTVAGTGTAGSSGDGGSAASAQLNTPYGVALDSASNLYIAEFGGNKVRKVSGSNISTFAGTGTAGYGGDGAQAAAAQLNGPQAVAVDGSGNVYIADTNNFVIRKVIGSGAISTWAGNGTGGASGDSGPATSAQIGSITGIAADSAGNLYLADSSARIRKVYVAGTIATIAGTGSAGYSGDGGPALSAQLNQPSGVGVDSTGALYIADTGNNAIRLAVPVSGGTNISAVTNGASNLTGSVAPGEVIVIYGSGLGPSNLALGQFDLNLRLARTLGGTTVYINGFAAPIVYTWSNQISAIVPFGLTGSAAQIVVQYQGQSAQPVVVPLAPAAPAIFTGDYSGRGAAVAGNIDGTLNGPNNPAKAGKAVTFFLTGAGTMTPAVTEGEIAGGRLSTLDLPVTATVGGQDAQVVYRGEADGLVAGVAAVTVIVPSGLTGNVPLIVNVNGVASQSGVTIAVSN